MNRDEEMGMSKKGINERNEEQVRGKKNEERVWDREEEVDKGSQCVEGHEIKR